MALYTERHGIRTPVERTSTITVEMYGLLFDCCEKYYDNIAWKFPELCPDGQGCCGLDFQQFSTHMKFDIPTLYRNSQGRITKPNSCYYGDSDEYDQFALLDLIEFIGQNCRDIIVGSFHSYFGHNHIRLLDTDGVADAFRNEINGIFKKIGLLFTLTDKMAVERVTEYDVLSPQVEKNISAVKEPGIRNLLEESIFMFRLPNPAARNNAVEKLWDAFERLKTYYTTLDKKRVSSEDRYRYERRTDSICQAI